MASKALCSISNCDKPIQARGWCSAHYQRWHIHGDPLAGVALRISKGTARRYIQTAAAFESDDCLVWPYARDRDGYGKISNNHAHRLVCEVAHGSPPTASHEAAHSCGKGHLGCVNPKHLRWATPQQNTDDKKSHGTSNRGLRNGSAKLSDSQIVEIRSLKGKQPQRSIAKRFGVSQALVSRIFNGLVWDWL